MDYVMDGLLGKGSVAVHSHAGNRRALYDAGKPLLPEGSRVDCILCDEVQDLDDQAMRLLERCPQQIVYVGDPNQKIYGFGDAFKCKCQFEASPAKPPYFPEDATVRLYRTFRLNRETVAFLRKTFPFVPMVAADGAPSVPDAVLPVPALPPLSYPGLCHLFRSNLDLCRAVERLPENVRVVGGGRSRARSRASFGGRTRTTCPSLPRGAAPLGRPRSSAWCDDLQGRDCASTESAKHPVACTVHRAKGSQHLDVALSHASFRAMVEQGGEEKRVAYVAASRHTRRLFLYGALETPGGRTRRTSTWPRPSRRRPPSPPSRSGNERRTTRCASFETPVQQIQYKHTLIMIITKKYSYYLYHTLFVPHIIRTKTLLVPLFQHLSQPLNFLVHVFLSFKVADIVVAEFPNEDQVTVLLQCGFIPVSMWNDGQLVESSTFVAKGEQAPEQRWATEIAVLLEISSTRGR